MEPDVSSYSRNCAIHETPQNLNDFSVKGEKQNHQNSIQQSMIKTCYCYENQCYTCRMVDCTCKPHKSINTKYSCIVLYETNMMWRADVLMANAGLVMGRWTAIQISFGVDGGSERRGMRNYTMEMNKGQDRRTSASALITFAGQSAFDMFLDKENWSNDHWPRWPIWIASDH